MSINSQLQRLETICTFSSGGTPSKKNEKFWGGDIPWVSGRDMKSSRISGTTLHITQHAVDESSSAKVAPAQTLLILVRGMGLAHGAQIAELMRPCAFNQDIRAIHPDDCILPRYLLLALRTRINMSDNVLSNAAHSDELRNVELPVPPKAEQKRIVSILDEAFSAIAKAKENAEKNLANARELFESYLNRVFTQQGPDWQETTVEEVSTVINGYAFKSGDFDGSNPIKSIKITNVGVGEFVEDASSKLPASFAKEFAKVAIPVGSIVLALTRTIIADGLKVAIVPAEFNHALLNQRVAALAPKPEVMTTGFLYNYFRTNIVADYVREKANTLMQPNLSITDLRALPIPVPSSKTEQTEIEARLQGMYAESKRLETIYTQKLANLDELKQSLLQKAFTGQLTGECALQEVTT